MHEFTHAARKTLISILDELYHLCRRVECLLAEDRARQRVVRYETSGVRFGDTTFMGNSGMTAHNPYEANASYIPSLFESHSPVEHALYDDSPSPMYMTALSRSLTPPSPREPTFRARTGPGGWLPPVTRAKPKVRRIAPERRVRRDEGKKGKGKGKGKGRKRRRVENEESNEESGSEEEDDDEGGRDGDIAGDRHEERGGGEGVRV